MVRFFQAFFQILGFLWSVVLLPVRLIASLFQKEWIIVWD